MDIKTVSSFVNERALVLGGGGSAGNAWLIGVIAGLYDAGLDLTKADIVIGTSAGSTVAAQISGKTKPPGLFTNILAEEQLHKTGMVGSDNRRIQNKPVVNHMETTNRIIASSKDLTDMRRRMGAWALEADATSHSSTEKWRSIVANRLLIQQWPQRKMLITAVDACTGEPVVFDKHSGVDLVDAVAASCAGGFAFGIGNSYYIDGGYRSNADNADLAVGYNRVLVLSPFAGKSRTPVDWGTHLVTQVDELRAKGSKVETIFPDNDTLEAFGNNMMDILRRPHSAQAGYNQGRTVVELLTKFWY